MAKKKRTPVLNTVIEEVGGKGGAQMRTDLLATKKSFEESRVAAPEIEASPGVEEAKEPEAKEPEAKEPEAKEGAPKKKKEPRKLDPIALRTFLAVCGRAPDQYVAFAKHAQQKRMGPRTLPQWEKVLAGFMDRKIK